MAKGKTRAQQDQKNQEMGAGPSLTPPGSHFRFLASPAAWAIATCIVPFLVSCAVFATRPIQEMSDTATAIRAAREVQADTLAPELFRQSSEWFQKAKNEYRLKNFEAAKEAANKSRRYAELAEFNALRSSGNRSEVNIPDPLSDSNALPGTGTLPESTHEPAPAHTPYDYPTPTGTPFTDYDRRKAEEDAEKRAHLAPSPSPSGQPQMPNFIPVFGGPAAPTLPQSNLQNPTAVPTAPVTVPTP